MKYLHKSFTMPTQGKRGMTDLEYDLAVGKITQEQFDAATNKTSLDVQATARVNHAPQGGATGKPKGKARQRKDVSAPSPR